MYAIISELDQESNLKFDQLRTDCMAGCELENPVMRWPFHLSWQGAQEYQRLAVEQRVKMIAKMFAPLEIGIDGIGVFTGEEPVLYFTVTRTPTISALNQTLWEALNPLAEGMNPQFSPEEWVPHISLIYGSKKSVSGLSCVIQKLIPMHLGMKVRIDHLSLVYYRGQESGEVFRFPLAGMGEPSLDQ